MGVAVYLENQIHGRTYAGPEAGAQLSRLLAKAKSEGLLAGVHLHGDTMFNMVQLARLDAEINAIAITHPELQPDVESLKEILQTAIRDRGYIWLSGD